MRPHEKYKKYNDKTSFLNSSSANHGRNQCSSVSFEALVMFDADQKWYDNQQQMSQLELT